MQPPPGGGSSLELEHGLSQEGLAIALASTVLQSQLAIVFSTTGGDQGGGIESTPCTTLPGGGSYQSLPAGDEAPTRAGVYYDAACHSPYIIADVHEVSGSGANSVTVDATALYSGPTGVSLGALVVHETAASDGASSLSVHGLGTFTPSNGDQVVHLGLTCTFDLSGKSTIPCQGGVVQNFPTLGRSLGSVTRLDLLADDLIGGTGGITFSGTNASVLSGGTDALTLGAPNASSLAIQGGTAIGTTSTTGSAGSFSLFPPPPTGWTITDTANDLRFSISVIDDATRTLSGKIERISTGAVLTTITLDRSGTGVITYSDGTHTAVTSWLLGDRPIS
jgi:hypothetical protein